MGASTIVGAAESTSHLTPQQKEAVYVAQRYMQTFDYSRKEIIQQVIHEFKSVETYSEALSRKDAEIAIDSLNIDWNKKALKSVISYLESGAVSREKLLQLLSGAYGKGFTVDQARYAMSKIDVDWNQQAVREAKEYLRFRSAMVDKLVIEDLYTVDQAVHGALMTGVCK